MADDYEVGYGKPPKSGQFRKGRSGNPKGRPKGGKNRAARISELLDEPVVVNEGGRRRRISKRDAMLMALVAKALKGDVRAFSKVEEIAERYLDSLESGAGTMPVSAGDRAIIEAYLERLKSHEAVPPGGADDETTGDDNGT